VIPVRWRRQRLQRSGRSTPAARVAY